MKKYKNIILTILLIIFILNLDIVIKSTKDSSILFFNKIFVSIFPFIILSDTLIYFDYHTFLKNTIGKIISKIFNIDPNTSIIFILSMLTSHPANAIYIKNMLDNNEININTANKILCFSYFPSISFVIGTIGLSIYKSLKIGIIIWLIVLINNILIGIYLRKENIEPSNQYLKIYKKNFFNIIKDSISKGINTSIMILGNLIIFTIIINILNKYIKLNKIILTILTGSIEITNGIIQTSLLDLDIRYKLSITIFILLFSSISVIFQSVSILNNYKINIKRILIIKLIFSIISSLLLLLISYLIL